MSEQTTTWLERKVNWIAATDKLPPMGREVICVDASGIVNEGWIMPNGKWRRVDGSKRQPTHWMEMPNPPAQFELMRVYDELRKAGAR